MSYAKILVGLAAFVAPIGLTNGPARADSHWERIRVRYDYAGGASNFTNCPVNTGAAIETDCVGTSVLISTLTTKVGEFEARVTTAYVDMFTVHIHLDGSFEIEPAPFASGSGSVKAEFSGVRSGKIRGEVPLSDGSIAKIRMALTGTGLVLNDYSGAGSVQEPRCPTQLADISWTGTVGEALATGTVTVRGVPQSPTTAVGTATLFVEHNRGACEKV